MGRIKRRLPWINFTLSESHYLVVKTFRWKEVCYVNKSAAFEQIEKYVVFELSARVRH